MSYISQIQVGTTTYDIHDSRITGNALNFAGVSDTPGWPADKTNLTTEELNTYSEGDVVVNTTSGKEFIVADVDGTLKWMEFGDASDMGGTSLENVVVTGTYTTVTGIENSNATVTASGSYTPAGSNTVSQSVDGTAVTFSGNYTPAGSVNVVLPTGSINKINSVSTANINTVNAVSTASVGTVATVNGTTLQLGSIDVVTGVTTAAQTVVNGVTTTAQTVVTGQPTEQIFEGTTGSVSVEGKMKVAFSGTQSNITVTGDYSKATGLQSTTTAPITLTSTKKFAAEAVTGS